MFRYTNRGIVMLHASDALFEKKKRRRTKSRWDILWQQKISFFKAPRECVVSNNPFLKTKTNGLFAHQSSAKDDSHGKAITLLRDGFTSTLAFFYVFYFYFSSSGNFHEAWTHRSTTIIIMAVSGKLILTIIQISNWNESQIQRFDSMSVTFC
jgi:hypothetical protein